MEKRREKAIVSVSRGKAIPSPQFISCSGKAVVEPINPGFSSPRCRASVKKGDRGGGVERKTHYEVEAAGDWQYTESLAQKWLEHPTLMLQRSWHWQLVG